MEGFSGAMNKTIDIEIDFNKRKNTHGNTLRHSIDVPRPTTQGMQAQ